MTAEAEDTLTDLRHDLDYLKRMLEAAIRLHRPANMEEATMLADIRDYFMYVALDAITDLASARVLAETFSMLQKWLDDELKLTPVYQAEERETMRFYIGFLFALEQTLSLKHETAVMPGEKISRRDFVSSFKRTAKKLGLS